MLYPQGLNESFNVGLGRGMTSNSMYDAMGGFRMPSPHVRSLKNDISRFNDYNVIGEMSNECHVELVDAISKAAEQSEHGRIYLFSVAKSPRSLSMRSTPLSNLEDLLGTAIYEFNTESWDLLAGVEFFDTVFLNDQEVRISIDDIGCKQSLLLYRLLGNPFVCIDGERFPMFISKIQIGLEVTAKKAESWNIDNLYRTISNSKGIEYERV